MLTPRGLALAIFTIYAGTAVPAHADPARSASFAEPSTTTELGASSRRWYGWQTLSLDGAALGLTLGGVRLHDEHPGAGIVLGATGLLTYSLSSPLVHWMHARPGAAGASLVLRVGLPLLSVGVLSGSSAARCPGTGGSDDERYCDRMERTLVVAGVVSMLAASLFDAATLGWEPRAATRTSATLQPQLAWDGRRGATAGLAGTF